MMMNCQPYSAAQMALPSHSSPLQQVPLQWHLPEQYSVTSQQSMAASALAALQSYPTSASPAIHITPSNNQLPCVDDFADCMSDLSDLDSCGATPSMSSVYELSCALSPASSVDSILSSEYERTSPLSHYPLQSQDATMSAEQIASACSAVEVAVQQETKPLLRKPIDVSKLDNRQVQRLMRRRERNKIAASKCRRKTKEKAASIRDELAQTNATNEELRREVELLRAEKEKLERILASHHCVLPDCGNESSETIVTPPSTPATVKSESPEPASES